MDKAKFRLDIVGLSTDDLPDASDKLDGSTYYTVDTGELYVCYKGEWYNQNQDEEPTENQDEEPAENNEGGETNGD